jgi:hypothetical protein
MYDPEIHGVGVRMSDGKPLNWPKLAPKVAPN